MNTTTRTYKFAASAAILVLVLVLGLWLWQTSDDSPQSQASEPTVSSSPQGSTVAGPRQSTRSFKTRIADGASISGTVRNTSGQPVAAAQVCAYVWTTLLPGRDAWRPNCVTSERDGHYQIEGLFPVRHRVTANAAGYVPGVYVRGEGASQMDAIDLRPATETDGVDIVLADGGVELKGIVRDLSGGPVEGARVMSDHAFTRSDAEGTFTMWVRPGPQSVLADAEGYASSNVEGMAPGHTFELFLTPEAVLVGKVVRVVSGEPLQGAVVKAGAQEWGRNYSTFTDAVGNFRIDGLEPGAYKPLVEADDARGSAVEQVILGIGETSAAVLIEAHSSHFVAGRVVVSGETGCEHGWVSLQDHSNGRHGEASVEGDGNVRVPALLPGTYAVTVGCAGKLSAESYDPIVILDKSQSDLTWKVTRGQAIRGRVVDADGKAVAGIEVQARQGIDPSRPRARETSARAKTNGDGRFELSGLLAARFNLSVAASRATLAEPVSVTLPEGEDVDDVRIELPATGEVRGTVVDERGHAVKRSTVSLHGGPKDFIAMVADDGNFKIEYVAVGIYQAVAEGRGGESQSGEAVEVQAGRVATLKIVVKVSSATISGHVRDGDGGPVTDAFVEAIREPEGEGGPSGPAKRGAPWGDFFGAPLLTEVDGRFTLKGLPPGKHTLRAFRKGGGEGFVEHVEPGANVVVTIAATGRLAGTVSVPGVASPEEFSLQVIDTTTGFNRRDTFFRTGGTWSVPELPAGRYKIRVNMGTATAESEASVRAGEDTTGLRIELAQKVSVRGTVIDLKGVPMAGLQVVVRAMEGAASTQPDQSQRHITDTSGRFELKNVPTGDVAIIIISQNPGINGAAENTRIPMKISGAAQTIELPPITLPRGQTPPGSAGE